MKERDKVKGKLFREVLEKELALNTTQKIALGMSLGSLLSIIPIIFLHGNYLEVLCILPITIISALIYAKTRKR